MASLGEKKLLWLDGGENRVGRSVLFVAECIIVKRLALRQFITEYAV